VFSSIHVVRAIINTTPRSLCLLLEAIPCYARSCLELELIRDADEKAMSGIVYSKALYTVTTVAMSITTTAIVMTAAAAPITIKRRRTYVKKIALDPPVANLQYSNSRT
jgi:hypothetical protein